MRKAVIIPRWQQVTTLTVTTKPTSEDSTKPDSIHLSSCHCSCLFYVICTGQCHHYQAKAAHIIISKTKQDLPGGCHHPLPILLTHHLHYHHYLGVVFVKHRHPGRYTSSTLSTRLPHYPTCSNHLPQIVSPHLISDGCQLLLIHITAKSFRPTNYNHHIHKPPSPSRKGESAHPPAKHCPREELTRTYNQAGFEKYKKTLFLSCQTSPSAYNTHQGKSLCFALRTYTAFMGHLFMCRKLFA